MAKRLSVAPTPRPQTLVHKREAAMSISHLGSCTGTSYVGLIFLTPEIEVKRMHCNGQHPGLDAGVHDSVWLITSALFIVLQDLKVFIREGASQNICPRETCLANTRSFNSASPRGNRTLNGITSL